MIKNVFQYTFLCTHLKHENRNDQNHFSIVSISRIFTILFIPLNTFPDSRRKWSKLKVR